MALTRQDQLLASPADAAARIAGASARQLRYWDQIGLVTPSFERSLGPRSNVRLYGFGDLVDLVVVATLRREGISLPHVRKVVDYLRRHGYEVPLRELRYAVSGDEVFFQHPDGSWEGDRRPQQIVLRHVVPLHEIMEHVRRVTQRSPEAAGQVVRRRKVMGSQPVFAGTRIPVATVIGYLEHGYTPEQIIEAFPLLTQADIAAARARAGAA